MEADWDMNTRKYSTLRTHNRTSVCGWNRIDSQCYIPLNSFANSMKRTEEIINYFYDQMDARFKPYR